METIRKIVDGNVLNQVITLPVTMQNTLVEIIVMPVENSTSTTLKRSELKAKLRGSHTESLSGTLPSNSEMTVAELHRERRIKYESTN